MQISPTCKCCHKKMSQKSKWRQNANSQKWKCHQKSNFTKMLMLQKYHNLFFFIFSWHELNARLKKSFLIADNIHLFIYWSKYCLQKKQADEKEFLNIKKKLTWFIGKFDSRNIHPCQKILSGERTINFFFNSQFPSNPHVQLFFE